jgi:hypothetical protein
MDKKQNQVPLGLSGLVTISKGRVATAARTTGRELPEFLLTEDERLDWLNLRLDRQLDYPLTGAGSGAIARKILARFPSDVNLEFCRKLLKTLREGEMHSTVAVGPGDASVAVCFVAWRGLWQDLAAKRYGLYVNAFFDCMARVEKLRPLVAFLQIDAFIAETVELEDPLRPLDESISLDVEFSYFPGRAFRTMQIDDPSVPKVILLNLDLCSEEQKNELKRMVQKMS